MHRRKRKFIMPALQLWLCLSFLCTALASVFILYSLVMVSLTEATVAHPDNALAMVGFLRDSMWERLLIAIGILVGLTLTLGVLATFRLCGPIHRLEVHLARVAAGENPGPLAFRSNDVLQHLPALVNAALDATLRPISEPASATRLHPPEVIAHE
ncbi:MAG: hypothetical protein ACKVX7_18545 [Planctomycetota bacterium]